MPVDIEKVANRAKAMLVAEKKAEARDAAADSSSETEKTKAEAVETVDVKVKVKEAEEQAIKDEEILSKDEGELDDSEKDRKVEITKVKAKVEVEDVKKEKSNVQKRFDELTSKIKNLEEDRNATKAEKEVLKSELDSIKKQLSMTPEDKTKEVVKAEVTARRKRFLDEDKTLPRSDRREMSQDEIDEWALENFEDYQEWLVKRSIRRVDDEREVMGAAKRNIAINAGIERINKWYDVAVANDAELNINDRKKELEAEGKSRTEVRKILERERPKWKAFIETIESDPDKYFLSEDGPSQLAAEMAKKIKPVEKSKDPEIETLKQEMARLKAENDSLKGLDVGITSTRKPEPKVETEISKKQEELARKVGLDPKVLAMRVAKRKAEGYDG